MVHYNERWLILVSATHSTMMWHISLSAMLLVSDYWVMCLLLSLNWKFCRWGSLVSWPSSLPHWIKQNHRMHQSNQRFIDSDSISKQECTHREQTSADPEDPDFGLWTPGSEAWSASPPKLYHLVLDPCPTPPKISSKSAHKFASNPTDEFQTSSSSSFEFEFELTRTRRKNFCQIFVEWPN